MELLKRNVLQIFRVVKDIILYPASLFQCSRKSSQKQIEEGQTSLTGIGEGTEGNIVYMEAQGAFYQTGNEEGTEGNILYTMLQDAFYQTGNEEGTEGYSIYTILQDAFYQTGNEEGTEGILDIGSADFQLGESSSKQKDVVVGLKDDISKIIDALTRPPSQLKVVPIAGMGGIGKTTLARKVCDSIAYQFHCFAWVDRVSKRDQVRDLLSNLTHSIAPSAHEIDGQSSYDLGERLRKSLKGRKYLIVMDDMWNMEAWVAIQRYFPDDQNGSRILITSRFMELPTIVNFQIPPHCMRFLNEKQSWELLEKLLFGEKSCPAELVDFGKRIAEKCGGLPLAIVIIADTLSRIPSTFQCWEDIAVGVNSVVCNGPKQCLDILAVSYNLLPNHLKPCFLYMGAFPAYSEIEVSKLISLWIAEGFLGSDAVSQREEMNYLEDLIARSLILVVKRSFNGKIKTCRIHDFIRELCLIEARKENFMCVLETDNQGFPEGIENQCRLIFNLDNCANLELLPSIPHLRSFMWHTLGLDFIPGMVSLQLLGFKSLRVLDMFFLRFDAFPVQILNLVDLRFLALNVTYELDSSMFELWNLQSLIIYGPWIPMDNEESPILLLEYWSMPWLRHLHFTVPSRLRNPSISPMAPRYLISLSTITFSSCTKEVFMVMPHLKKLVISESRDEYSNDATSNCLENLLYLQELEILKCSFYRGNREARSLRLDALPSNLKELTLSGSRLSWNTMSLIASLPKLEMLKLKNHAFQGPHWELTTEVFCCLKQLLIDSTDLVHWEAASTDHFPRLERLVLRSCKSLIEIPPDVLFCVLERIELHYCGEYAEKSAKEFQEQNGVPEVITRGEWPSCSA